MPYFSSATLYVPKGSKEKYEATAAWNLFQTIIELDDETTGMDAIANGSEATVTERYALGGQRMSAQQRGLGIVRMSDGTVKKVISSTFHSSKRRESEEKAIPMTYSLRLSARKASA